ncbi:PREDICTED: RNA-binding protein 40 [Thamnophis sirtalis]|uniref:RNA-binding region-containing protein 3 n=1 Tax=Thamnophis sirtalis TaxID=35019 RepID=A0A6I9Z027_9SAUR|nr:PREDICTED: RNA-binding protein 40 [Thamnophis sirtalis]
MAGPSSEASGRQLRPGKSNRILLVRHLPAVLTASEKEELLRHFGASSVRILSDHGRLKHTAFATFPNENAATQALSKLHQLNLLGHTLVVEYAKDQESGFAISEPSEKDKSLEEPVKEEKGQKDLSCLRIESGVAPSHGLTFPINSCLKYLYPPPSSTILANIANALASVPKFYVQVLHLMNKMNLPPPFGPITVRPPMHTNNLHPALTPSDVFEQPQTIGIKKIEFNISSETPTILQKSVEKEHNDDSSSEADDITNEGFGKIFPALSSNHKEDTEDEEDEIPSEFVSKRVLEKGRISKKEMETLSVFKNYDPGDPNCRIYVKNLSKQVQEKDLKFIFGKYIDFSSETERIMFDIRLMKEGRMKGQAFIGLPNEKAAAKALKETNGYLLFDKPMVVQFARSARPKPDAKDKRKPRGEKNLKKHSCVNTAVILCHEKCILSCCILFVNLFWKKTLFSSIVIQAKIVNHSSFI